MDDRIRINVRTSDALDSWLYSLEKSCNRAGLRFRGKKLSKEGLVNAILASLCSTDPSEVVKQVGAGLPLYESQLAIESAAVAGTALTKVS